MDHFYHLFNALSAIGQTELTDTFATNYGFHSAEVLRAQVADQKRFTLIKRKKVWWIAINESETATATEPENITAETTAPDMPANASPVADTAPAETPTTVETSDTPSAPTETVAGVDPLDPVQRELLKGVAQGFVNAAEALATDELTALRAELAQAKADLSAFRVHRERELTAAKDVQECEDALENAKAKVTKCKAELDEAHEDLAAIVNEEPGQQSLFVPQGDPTPKVVTTASSQITHLILTASSADPIPDDRRTQAIRHGLTIDKLAAAMAGSKGLFESQKRPMVIPVTAHGIPCLVEAWINVTEGIPGSSGDHADWRLIPLATKEEWESAHQETYGKPYNHLLDLNEADSNRLKAGGRFCGMVVRIANPSGKRGAVNMVISPDSVALIVTTEPVTNPVEDIAPKDTPAPTTALAEVAAVDEAPANTGMGEHSSGAD